MVAARLVRPQRRSREGLSQERQLDERAEDAEDDGHQNRGVAPTVGVCGPRDPAGHDHRIL